MNGEMGDGKEVPEGESKFPTTRGRERTVLFLLASDFPGLQLQPSFLEISRTPIPFSPHFEAHLTPNQGRKRGTWKKLHQKEFFSANCVLQQRLAARIAGRVQNFMYTAETTASTAPVASLGTNSKQVFGVHQA